MKGEDTCMPCFCVSEREGGDKVKNEEEQQQQQQKTTERQNTDAPRCVCGRESERVRRESVRVQRLTRATAPTRLT